MGAIDRSNGGVLGVDNTSKSELITNFPSSGTFTARDSTTAVDVLVVAGGGRGLWPQCAVNVCRGRRRWRQQY